MSEPEPQREHLEQQGIPVPLRGPHTVSSLDAPPPPAAIKVHQAVVRKHLLEQKAQPER
jgi:hypothetical protein